MQAYIRPLKASECLRGLMTSGLPLLNKGRDLHGRVHIQGWEKPVRPIMSSAR